MVQSMGGGRGADAEPGGLRVAGLSPARAGMLALAAGLVLAAGALGWWTPLQAQEGEAAAPAATGASGVSIRMDDLVGLITYSIVDRFEVQLTGLDAAAAYEVRVSSDNAPALGIGGCGTAAQPATVTGAPAQGWYVIVYACGLGDATVTAEVRRVGASSAEVAVSQDVTVQPIPDFVPAAARPVRGASGAVAQVGTPGIVPNVRFDRITTTSFRARWDKPADGGQALTGYGVLRRRSGQAWPPYSQADVVSGRSKTYRGLRPKTTYQVRVHACNGPDSCGWWTGGASVTTRPEPTSSPSPSPTATVRPAGAPGPVRNLRVTRGPNRLQVRWDAPSADGGRALTGYHVQHRAQGNEWPAGAAVVTGGTSHTLSAATLRPDTTYYDVRVQACNGACGAWVTAPSATPSISLPKTAIAIGERMSVGANDVPLGAVAWLRVDGPIQPAGRCAAGATGADAVGAAPSPSTGPGYYDSMWIEGCAAGTGTIRLESQDGSVEHDQREVTVAAAATERPGRVGRPVVTAYHAALRVTWSAPGAGGAPAHYDVRHRAGTAGTWAQQRAPDNAFLVLDGLTNGQSYEVQVRACNAVGCSESWSETATGTPSGAGPVITATPGPTVTPAPIAGCGTIAPGALASPRDLNVLPQSQRRALLTWVGVTSAKFYGVNVSEVGSSDSVTYQAPEPCYTLELDKLIIGTVRGLQHAPAFELRIDAHDGSGKVERSKVIRIIDTPITSANGHSPGDPQAVIKWTTVKDREVLNDNVYAAGTYELRFRRVLGDYYADQDWRPDDFGPVLPVATSGRDASSYIINRDLTMRQLYALQIVYRESPTALHDMDVFAARDVFFWPSASPRLNFGPRTSKQFAGFNLLHAMPTRTYAYRICTDTFPPGPASDPDYWKNKWMAIIEHAFEQWELATDGIVTMTYDRTPCTSYSTIIEKLVNDVVVPLELSGLPPGILTQHIRNFVVMNQSLLLSKKMLENGANEVIMFDDMAFGNDQTLEPYLRALSQSGFPEMSGVVGALGFAENPACWKPLTIACAPSSLSEELFPEAQAPSTDIFVRRSKVEFDPLDLPGGNMSTDRSDIRLNTCPSLPLPPVEMKDPVTQRVTMSPNSNGSYSVYGVLVHEAGHALGLRGHPGIVDPAPFKDTVMAPDEGRGCSPYPLDVLALYGLYQSR